MNNQKNVTAVTSFCNKKTFSPCTSASLVGSTGLYINKDLFKATPKGSKNHRPHAMPDAIFMVSPPNCRLAEDPQWPCLSLLIWRQLPVMMLSREGCVHTQDSPLSQSPKEGGVCICHLGYHPLYQWLPAPILPLAGYEAGPLEHWVPLGSQNFFFFSKFFLFVFGNSAQSTGNTSFCSDWGNQLFFSQFPQKL